MMTPRTLLEALIQKLHGCNVHGEAEEAPVAVLWTDPRSEWKPLIPLPRQQLPEHQQGPALWLRCIVDRSLPAAEAAAGQIPVIYLPGVSRQELRAGEGCPWELEPLIELMFRGSLWLQRNGRDWTLAAFLSSGDALGLDLAGDQSTKAALSRALAELATVPLDQLRGKRLEAEDFDALLADDPTRDLLQWMADPHAFQLRCGEERWSALTAIWKKELKFDPAKDGALYVAEQLAKGKGSWAQLGLSPMAQLLEPLGLLAQRADQPLVGSTPQRLAGSGDGEHSPGRRGAHSGGSTAAPLAG